MTSLTVNAIRRQAARIFSSVATPLFQDLLSLESCGRFSGLHLEAGERHIDAISLIAKTAVTGKPTTYDPVIPKPMKVASQLLRQKNRLPFPADWPKRPAIW
jgi:hypothetical protein